MKFFCEPTLDRETLFQTEEVWMTISVVAPGFHGYDGPGTTQAVHVFGGDQYLYGLSYPAVCFLPLQLKGPVGSMKVVPSVKLV